MKLRPIRSAQKASGVLISEVLPRSSDKTIGVTECPAKTKVDICNSGKARPIPSASAIGKSILAAATIGIIELIPPASIGKVP